MFVVINRKCFIKTVLYRVVGNHYMCSTIRSKVYDEVVYVTYLFVHPTGKRVHPDLLHKQCKEKLMAVTLEYRCFTTSVASVWICLNINLPFAVLRIIHCKNFQQTMKVTKGHIELLFSGCH